MKINKFFSEEQRLSKLLLALKQSIKYRLGIQSSQLRYKDTSDLGTYVTESDPHDILRLIKQSDAANYLNPQKRYVGPFLYKTLNFLYKKLKNIRALTSRILRAFKRRASG
jgi:hypothetical protein